MVKPIKLARKNASWKRKPVYTVGHPRDRKRGEFADVEPVERKSDAEGNQSTEDPLALARKMNRLFQTDHEKLDRLSNVDDLWDEMDQDAIVSAARAQLQTAIAGAELEFDEGSDDVHTDYVSHIWRPASDLYQDSLQAIVDSYCRGFVLGETAIEEIRKGDFAGLDTIGLIRRIDRGSYRLQEDGYGRPRLLELTVEVDPIDPSEQTGKSKRIWGGQTIQTDTLVIADSDAEWSRYLFLTSPQNSPRVAGSGAYIAAWPHYYFLLHLNQWMRSGAEKLGTVPVFAKYTSPLAEGLGTGQYAQTKDEVFNQLQALQTHFRGVLPSGWEIEFANTNAQGMADFLLGLASHARAMVEISIVLQQVGSGSEATLGTAGANQAILSGTFGGLVRSQQRRFASLIDAMNERLLTLNYGEVDEAPRARFENPDPEEEASRLARIRDGITAGVILQTEPWLRTEFGAPALDEEVLARALEARRQIAEADLTPEPVGAGQSAREVKIDELQSVLDRITDGDIGIQSARMALRSILPEATPEDVEAMIAEAQSFAVPTTTAGVGSVLDGDVDAATGGADKVQDLALNGAQVTALQGMLAAVGDGTLAPEAGVLSILSAFPSIDEARARSMVEAQSALPKQPTEDTTGNAVAASEPTIPMIQHRMGEAIDKLAAKVTSGTYDASKPAPIRTTVFRVYKRHTDMDERSASYHAEDVTNEITAWLASELPQCETETDRAALMGAIRDYYTDADTIVEALR